MKWYENGIMFEGTPAEFRALHPEIAGSAPVSAINVFPEVDTAPEQIPAKTPGKRGGRPVCTSWRSCREAVSGTSNLQAPRISGTAPRRPFGSIVVTSLFTRL